MEVGWAGRVGGQTPPVLRLHSLGVLQEVQARVHPSKLEVSSLAPPLCRLGGPQAAAECGMWWTEEGMGSTVGDGAGSRGQNRQSSREQKAELLIRLGKGI